MSNEKYIVIDLDGKIYECDTKEEERILMNKLNKTCYVQRHMQLFNRKDKKLE